MSEGLVPWEVLGGFLAVPLEVVDEDLVGVGLVVEVVDDRA